MSRRRRLVLRIALIVLAVLAARFAIGITTAWWHYTHTPDFATYLREHPVDTAALPPFASEVEPLSPTDSLVAGEVDPALLTPQEGDHERTTRVVTIELWHGEENVFQFRQKIHLALDRTDWSRRGLRIESPDITTGDGLRACVDIRVRGFDELFTAPSPQHGVTLDVVLAAGEAEPRTRIYREPADADRARPLPMMLGADPLHGFPWWCLVLGIANPTGGLADEGLFHQFRVHVDFDESKHGNGRSLPSARPPRHSVSTEEYSYRMKIEQVNAVDDQESLRSSTEWSRTWTWNDEVW